MIQQENRKCERNNTRDSLRIDKLRVFAICSTLCPTYNRKIIFWARDVDRTARRLSRTCEFYTSIYPRSREKQMCKVERTRCDISFTAIAPSWTSWISNFQYFLVLRAFETLILSSSHFLSLRYARRANTAAKLWNNNFIICE